MKDALDRLMFHAEKLFFVWNKLLFEVQQELYASRSRWESMPKLKPAPRTRSLSEMSHFKHQQQPQRHQVVNAKQQLVVIEHQFESLKQLKLIMEFDRKTLLNVRLPAEYQVKEGVVNYLVMAYRTQRAAEQANLSHIIPNDMFTIKTENLSSAAAAAIEDAVSYLETNSGAFQVKVLEFLTRQQEENSAFRTFSHQRQSKIRAALYQSICAEANEFSDYVEYKSFLQTMLSAEKFMATLSPALSRQKKFIVSGFVKQDKEMVLSWVDEWSITQENITAENKAKFKQQLVRGLLYFPLQAKDKEFVLKMISSSTVPTVEGELKLDVPLADPELADRQALGVRLMNRLGVFLYNSDKHFYPLQAASSSSAVAVSASPVSATALRRITNTSRFSQCMITIPEEKVKAVAPPQFLFSSQYKPMRSCSITEGMLDVVHSQPFSPLSGRPRR